ncbi:MAG: TolC family protein [Pseudomonadota bacterium]
MLKYKKRIFMLHYVLCAMLICVNSISLSDSLNQANNPVEKELRFIDRELSSYSFKKIDNNYAHILCRLLHYNIDVYDKSYDAFHSVNLDKKQFARSLTGELSFNSSLSPTTSAGQEFYSSLKYNVNLFKFGVSIYKYLGLAPMFKSSFYDFLFFINQKGMEAMEKYYDYQTTMHALQDVNNGIMVYDVVYQNTLQQQKYGTSTLGDIIKLKTTMHDMLLRKNQLSIKKDEKEVELNMMIGDDKLDKIDMANMDVLMFDNIDDYIRFVCKYDYQLLSLRNKCDLLDLQDKLQKIDRFAPALNFNFTWFFGGNFADNNNIKSIYKADMFNYKFNNDTKETSYDLNIDWNISNVIFGNVDKAKRDYSVQKRIMKKRYMVYKSQLHNRAQSLYKRYKSELNVLKLIKKNLQDTEKLAQTNLKAYKLGAVELRTLYDILTTLDKYKERVARQQGTVYLTATRINSAALYFIPEIRKQINKYCLRF